jgi:GTP cyclohydrolase I
MKYAMVFAAVAGLTQAACQPAKLPEQVQAERNAAELKDMISALGGEAAIDGQPVTPEQMAAAMEQAGAMAGLMSPEMSAENRARLQRNVVVLLRRIAELLVLERP